MRILSISPYYSPEGGGLERYAHRMLAALVQRGHEAHALAFTRLGPGTADQDGVQVERLLPVARAGNTPIDPMLAGTVRERIRSLRPDVVLAHTPVPFPAEMAFLAARREKVPFVLTYHAGTLRGSSALLEVAARVDRLTLERRMIAGSAGLVAVSPYVTEHALKRQRSRVTVIPPGVDATTFTPGPWPRKPEILFVGPLSTNYGWKGLDTLWSAFRLVRQEVPDACLRLVGSGDRAEEFQAHAAGAKGCVRVDTRLTDGQLAEAYQQAAVLCLPSLTDAESFGMVLAEANACATPVVASDVGGIPSFVRDGVNGLLSPPGDAPALAERLVRLLRDQEAGRAMGEAGRRIVERDHDWGLLAHRMEAVLQSACRPSVLASRAVPRARVPG